MNQRNKTYAEYLWHILRIPPVVFKMHIPEFAEQGIADSQNCCDNVMLSGRMKDPAYFPEDQTGAGQAGNQDHHITKGTMDSVPDNCIDIIGDINKEGCLYPLPGRKYEEG